MTLSLLTRQHAVRRFMRVVILAALWVCSTAAIAAPYVELASMAAPSKAAQLIYSNKNQRLIIRNAASAIFTINLATQAVSTHFANVAFTDMALSPSGRYVFASDYGGENIGYSTPVGTHAVHRLDLETGLWESRSVYIAARVQALSDDHFIVKSQDQWVSFTLYQWGTGSAANALNKPSYANRPDYYAGVYYGEFRYEPASGRLLFGNNGSSSQELAAFKIVDNNFQKQESSGTYGSAQGYGGTVVLATDANALYYGKLKIDALDVTHNIKTFAELIYAANSAVAFGEKNYYDATTGSQIASLGFDTRVYGLDSAASDFWVYDAAGNALRHFSTLPPATGTLTSLRASCPAALLKVGNSVNCTATASYAGANDKTVEATWTGSNAEVLTVTSAGRLTPVTSTTPSSGTVTVHVTASYTEGNVTKQSTESVTVDQASAPIGVGSSGVTCFLDWAQASSPFLFPTQGKAIATVIYSPYSFRFFPLTTTYLGVQTVSGQVVYAGPLSSNQLIELGDFLGYWSTLSGCR